MKNKFLVPLCFLGIYCSLAFINVEAKQNKAVDIKITLTEQEANTFTQTIDKAMQIVNDSDMKAEERKEVKRLLASSTQLLISKVDKPIDTVKKLPKKQ